MQPSSSAANPNVQSSTNFSEIEQEQEWLQSLFTFISQVASTGESNNKSATNLSDLLSNEGEASDVSFYQILIFCAFLILFSILENEGHRCIPSKTHFNHSPTCDHCTSDETAISSHCIFGRCWRRKEGRERFFPKLVK